MTNFDDEERLDSQDLAHLLGIPYAEVMQVALLPVAYTQGSAFRPGPRKPLQTLIHWETW